MNVQKPNVLGDETANTSNDDHGKAAGFDLGIVKSAQSKADALIDESLQSTASLENDLYRFERDATDLATQIAKIEAKMTPAQSELHRTENALKMASSSRDVAQASYRDAEIAYKGANAESSRLDAQTRQFYQQYRQLDTNTQAAWRSYQNARNKQKAASRAAWVLLRDQTAAANSQWRNSQSQRDAAIGRENAMAELRRSASNTLKDSNQLAEVALRRRDEAVEILSNLERIATKQLSQRQALLVGLSILESRTKGIQDDVKTIGHLLDSAKSATSVADQQNDELIAIQRRNEQLGQQLSQLRQRGNQFAGRLQVISNLVN
jgi:chromosome segregation ATPase